MPNEEYLKRQQRKRYVAIGSTIVSVLIIVGWITFYQVPESNTDAPSLSEQIQGTWNETREEYDPVIVEDSFNEAIEAFNNFSEAAETENLETVEEAETTEEADEATQNNDAQNINTAALEGSAE